MLVYCGALFWFVCCACVVSGYVFVVVRCVAGLDLGLIAWFYRYCWLGLLCWCMYLLFDCLCCWYSCSAVGVGVGY